MPTMEEYAKAGGYERDAQAARDIASRGIDSYSSAPSSSRENSDSSNSYTPPASLGSLYKPVQGTDWWSTHPDNPNATKYTSDNRPVATIGYSNQQTGQNFQGYGTVDQANQIRNLSNNPTALSDYMKNAMTNNQLVSQGSVYNPSGGIANAPSGPQTGTPQNGVAYATKDWKTDQLTPNAGAAGPVYASGQGNQQPATPNRGLYQDPYARTPESIAALAKSRIDAILQGGRTAAQGALTGAKNANEYTNQIKGDNRVLEDFTFKNRNDPFSGNTSYLEAQNLRNRSIQDTAQNKDYTAQVGQINQKLADLEAAAPADQQKIIDDLTQIERTTGINVAQLQEQQKQNQFSQGMQQQQFGLQSQNQQFNQGMQQRQFDQTAQNNQFNQGLAGKQFEQQTQQQQFNQEQAVKKQHIDLANFLTEKFNKLVTPTDDPMLSYSQVADLPTAAAQKLALDAANMSFDNAIKKALAENTITKSQADIMHQAQQIGISQQNADTSAASSANSKNNANQTHLIEVWKATGKAPAGITGVPEGTAYVHAPTASQNNNQAIGKIVTDVKNMTPENRKRFFKEQESNIVAEHGLTTYNELYNKYYDKNGDPK